MYEYKTSKTLKKILNKLQVKDKVRFEAVLNKIKEVITSSDITHYKNFRYDMKEYRRVHIDSSFVLIFKIEGNIILFEDLQHHDDMYRR